MIYLITLNKQYDFNKFQQSQFTLDKKIHAGKYLYRKSHLKEEEKIHRMNI